MVSWVHLGNTTLRGEMLRRLWGSWLLSQWIHREALQLSEVSSMGQEQVIQQQILRCFDVVFSRWLKWSFWGKLGSTPWHTMTMFSIIFVIVRWISSNLNPGHKDGISRKVYEAQYRSKFGSFFACLTGPFSRGQFFRCRCATSTPGVFPATRPWRSWRGMGPWWNWGLALAIGQRCWSRGRCFLVVSLYL